MTDDDRPELTNSGLTDPAAATTLVRGSSSAIAASTPFAITSTATPAHWCAADGALGRNMTNSGSIVVAALEEAAQAVIQPDVALGQVDELCTAVQGPAVRDVLTARAAQIVAGHDAGEDDMLPIGWLPMEARKCFERVRDMLGDDHRHLPAVRAQIVEGVAFGLAAIDRLDRAMKVKGS